MMPKILALLLCVTLNGWELKIFEDIESKLENKTFLLSEKYDGVRAIWRDGELKTKRDNIIQAPKCFLDTLPPFDIEGELWLGYNGFEKIQGLANAQSSTCEMWEDVKFMIFDVDAKGDLLSRLDILKAWLDTNKRENIILIKQEAILGKNLKSSIKERLQKIIDKNGEGLVARLNDAPYTKGKERIQGYYKIKKHSDATCKVIGYTKGNGKYEGKVGALLCQVTWDKNSDISESSWKKISQKCSTCEKINMNIKIGSGLDDDLRVNPPKIDTQISFSYDGFNKNGIPKFVRFKRILQ